MVGPRIRSSEWAFRDTGKTSHIPRGTDQDEICRHARPSSRNLTRDSQAWLDRLTERNSLRLEGSRKIPLHEFPTLTICSIAEDLQKASRKNSLHSFARLWSGPGEGWGIIPKEHRCPGVEIGSFYSKTYVCSQLPCEAADQQGQSSMERRHPSFSQLGQFIEAWRIDIQVPDGDTGTMRNEPFSDEMVGLGNMTSRLFSEGHRIRIDYSIGILKYHGWRGLGSITRGNAPKEENQGTISTTSAIRMDSIASMGNWGHICLH